jgi:hypothetical protein
MDYTLAPRFKTISKATLTTVLLKKGLRSVLLRGTRPSIMTQVEAGASLLGLYPPNADNRARFEAWRAALAKAAE